MMISIVRRGLTIQRSSKVARCIQAYLVIHVNGKHTRDSHYLERQGSKNEKTVPFICAGQNHNRQPCKKASEEGSVECTAVKLQPTLRFQHFCGKSLMCSYYITLQYTFTITTITTTNTTFTTSTTTTTITTITSNINHCHRTLHQKGFKVGALTNTFTSTSSLHQHFLH